MSDHFDKAMQDIAIKSAKNGGPDTQDILTAMQASHLDATEGRNELAKTVEKTAAALHKEVLDAAEQRAKDIDAAATAVREELIDYRDKMADRCAEQHRKLFEDEFAQYAVPRAPRRTGDAADIDYTLTEKSGIFPEIEFSYKFLKWVAAIILVVVLGWLLPYWADSCSRQHYWGKETPTLVASPTPTQSP